MYGSSNLFHHQPRNGGGVAGVSRRLKYKVHDLCSC